MARTGVCPLMTQCGHRSFGAGRRGRRAVITSRLNQGLV